MSDNDKRNQASSPLDTQQAYPDAPDEIDDLVTSSAPDTQQAYPDMDRVKYDVEKLCKDELNELNEKLKENSMEKEFQKLELRITRNSHKEKDHWNKGLQVRNELDKFKKNLETWFDRFDSLVVKNNILNLKNAYKTVEANEEIENMKKSSKRDEDNLDEKEAQFDVFKRINSVGEPTINAEFWKSLRWILCLEIIANGLLYKDVVQSGYIQGLLIAAMVSGFVIVFGALAGISFWGFKLKKIPLRINKVNERAKNWFVLWLLVFIIAVSLPFSLPSSPIIVPLLIIVIAGGGATWSFCTTQYTFKEKERPLWVTAWKKSIWPPRIVFFFAFVGLFIMLFGVHEQWHKNILISIGVISSILFGLSFWKSLFASPETVVIENTKHEYYPETPIRKWPCLALCLCFFGMGVVVSICAYLFRDAALDFIKMNVDGGKDIMSAVMSVATREMIDRLANIDLIPKTDIITLAALFVNIGIVAFTIYKFHNWKGEMALHCFYYDQTIDEKNKLKETEKAIDKKREEYDKIANMDNETIDRYIKLLDCFKSIIDAITTKQESLMEVCNPNATDNVFFVDIQNKVNNMREKLDEALRDKK